MIQREQSYVLVDLRDRAVAEKGHILGAVSIPAPRLAEAKSLFPEDKAAPIILYTASGHDENSFRTVQGWGYRNVSVLAGGVETWLQTQGRLFSDSLPDTINYVKRLPRGEISVEEFTQLVKNQAADKIILDVRDAETVANGRLAKAVHIPLAAVGDRLAELDRGKEIIIHCNTGIMASMAHETLIGKGFNTRFLNAVVQVGENGSYEITEK
jgi:rhodanese-related sulfurtransferase